MGAGEEAGSPPEFTRPPPPVSGHLLSLPFIHGRAPHPASEGMGGSFNTRKGVLSMARA